MYKIKERIIYNVVKTPTALLSTQALKGIISIKVKSPFFSNFKKLGLNTLYKEGATFFVDYVGSL